MGTTLAGLALASNAPAETNSAGGRQILSMNQNWLFGGRNVPGAAAPDFNDSAFAKVTLPHSNVMLPWHSFDDRSYEFTSIYRRHFRTPESARRSARLH